MENDNDPSMSLSSARRIDAASDRFEKDLRRGVNPSIETFLLNAPADDRQDLLRELLQLEIDYRIRRGDTPDPKDYLKRFPELESLWLFNLIAPIKAKIAGNAAADEVTIVAQDQTKAWDRMGSIRYFGDYELLSEIARGGMGVVYKARQISLDRTVAIKRVLAGQLASKNEVERFYGEAKAAAQLDHPNIVPVFEVGCHQGLQYLAMGFVDGKSLDQLTTDVLIETREIARIMLLVSHAIQYSHDKGIIHRDIKPSNILLDKAGVPKVTDFGLAKRLDEQDGQTFSGQIIGTPSYMSPEQAAGMTNAIGVHSDIYALGAVLYALLTGRPPFKGPSAAHTLTQVLEQEPVSPTQLNSSVPKDLETIALKCLEKSISRRYASAREVAAELSRFLEGRPILARPIGKLQRTWRWCRRNPVTSALSFSLALALVAGSVICAWFAWRENKQATAEKLARNIAERQTEIAKGLNEFLTIDILGQADIWNQAETEKTVNPNITVKETLDRSAARLGERFAGKPEIEAAIRRALGSAYTALGEHTKAIDQLEQTIALSENLAEVSPEEKKSQVESEYLLAKSYWLAKNPKEADSAFRNCLKKAIHDIGPESRERMVVQTSLAFIHLGQNAEALTLLEEMQPIVDNKFEAGDTDVLHYKNTLGLAQQFANQMDRALETFTTSHVEAKAKLGDKNPLTMMLLNNRGRWYLINKQPSQALEVFEQLEPLVTEQLGQDSPNAILTRCNLAYCCFDVGQFERAVELLKTVVPAMQTGLGPNEPRARTAKLTLAKALKQINQVESATDLYAELWSGIGPKQPPLEIVPGLVGTVAKRLVDAGERRKFLELAKVYSESLPSSKENMDLLTADEMEIIGGAFAKLEEYQSAETWARRSLELRMILAPMDWRTYYTEMVLSEFLLAANQTDQAHAMLSRVWKDLQPKLETLSVSEQTMINQQCDRIIDRFMRGGNAVLAEQWRLQFDAVKK